MSDSEQELFELIIVGLNYENKETDDSNGDQLIEKYIPVVDEGLSVSDVEFEEHFGDHSFRTSVEAIDDVKNHFVGLFAEREASDP